MFARVRVPGSPAYPALLIPDAAIASEQARKFVLVVDAENTAQQRYVTLGQLVGNLRVIKDGLKPDDRVVVNGTDARAAGRQGHAGRAGRGRQRERSAADNELTGRRCVCRISSSTGRSLPRWSRSCS